jgi:hypothetical protein
MVADVKDPIKVEVFLQAQNVVATATQAAIQTLLLLLLLM